MENNVRNNRYSSSPFMVAAVINKKIKKLCGKMQFLIEII